MDSIENIENIFKFSFPYEAFPVHFMNKLSVTQHTLSMLREMIDYFNELDIADDVKHELTDILKKEVELIIYAQRTKNNIISV